MPGVEGRGLQIASGSWSCFGVWRQATDLTLLSTPMCQRWIGDRPRRSAATLLRSWLLPADTPHYGSSLQTHRHLTWSGDGMLRAAVACVKGRYTKQRSAVEPVQTVFALLVVDLRLP